MNTKIDKAAFPELRADGSCVDVRECIEPGTKRAVVFGVIYTLILFAVADLALSAVGRILQMLVTAFVPPWQIICIATFLCILAGAFILHALRTKKSASAIRGDSLEVSSKQVPEIHKCVSILARRLRLETPPAVFIRQKGEINAEAMKMGKGDVVILYDRLIDACLASGNQQCLTFIIAHELAHAKLGHARLPRGLFSCVYRHLSRLDEFTCDRIAGRLVPNNDACAKAIILLTIGPDVARYTDLDEFYEQARRVAKDEESVGAEILSTHPLLLRRLARFIE